MSYTGTGQFKRVSAGSTTYMTSGLGLNRVNNTHYTHDDNRQLISQRTATGNYYYLLDGLGSVAALTDSTGNVAATYGYEPVGKLTSSTGTIPNPHRRLGALGVYHDTSNRPLQNGYPLQRPHARPLHAGRPDRGRSSDHVRLRVTGPDQYG